MHPDVVDWAVSRLRTFANVFLVDICFLRHAKTAGQNFSDVADERRLIPLRQSQR